MFQNRLCMFYVANSEELNVYFHGYLVNDSSKSTIADVDLRYYKDVELYYCA